MPSAGTDCNNTSVLMRLLTPSSQRPLFHLNIQLLMRVARCQPSPVQLKHPPSHCHLVGGLPLALSALPPVILAAELSVLAQILVVAHYQAPKGCHAETSTHDFSDHHQST
jgi:hypothetical protein